VDEQLGVLIAGDFPASVNRLSLSVMDGRGSLSARRLDGPAPVVGHNMLAALCHFILSAYRYGKITLQNDERACQYALNGVTISPDRSQERERKCLSIRRTSLS
jgi:hypothetical protein